MKYVQDYLLLFIKNIFYNILYICINKLVKIYAGLPFKVKEGHMPVIECRLHLEPFSYILSKLVLIAQRHDMSVGSYIDM